MQEEIKNWTTVGIWNLFSFSKIVFVYSQHIMKVLWCIKISRTIRIVLRN